MTEGEDPWQVLGVGREADERTLKKRYFALLREFPPETHPDDFARIQRAWEIVSDPAKRADHTATQEPFFEVAEPWRSRLREALSLLKTDRVDLARVQLKTLVEENPDLLEARELLEQVYFNHEQWADAERELREMVARRPGQAHFLSRLILVLGRLERHADALAVAEAWREESHGRDAMAWVYVAETQSALKRHDDAFKTLAAGVAQAERKTVLVITRLQLRLETTEKPGPALKAMREDLELLARVADADEESRKAISQRLQSMAALFFNRNRATEGNELINASRRFWAETRAIQFPRRVDVDIDDLPPKSREWLVEESTNPHVFRVLRRGWVADVVVAVLASVPPALFAGMLLTTDSAWAFGSLALLSVALGASSWAMVWAWRRVALSFTVPHRRMVAVHPLYMLEVGLERMTAWPLVNFSDVRVVHHHTNGVYTQSVVTLTFAGKRRNVGIRGQELAVRFAETLQGLRYRALQLLHGGVLEADEAYDFIAADRLVSPPAPPTPLRLRRRRALVWRSAAVALASIAVVACSGWLGAVAQRERDLGAVLQSQNAQTIGSVLLAQSNPKAREVAERWWHTLLDRRTPALEAALEGDPARTERLHALLAVLRQRPLGVLTATLHGQGAGAVGPGFARAVENGLMAERSWLASPLVNAGPAKAAQSIELALKVEVQPVANTMTGPDGRDAAQRVTARVELKSPAQPAATVAAFEVDAEFTEADAVMLTAADPASAQQAVLGQKLGRSIARALGIGRSAAVR